jgi:hypothetical protein
MITISVSGLTLEACDHIIRYLDLRLDTTRAPAFRRIHNASRDTWSIVCDNRETSLVLVQGLIDEDSGIDYLT